MTLAKIDDVSPYFSKEGSKWIFTGKKLEIFIPQFYNDRGLMTISETVTTIGIFQIRINDALFANFMLLANINISFVSINQVSEDGFDYTVLSLESGSAFINNTSVVKDGNLIYSVFVAFLSLGRIPPFISYEAINSLFDNDAKLCGVDLKVNHTIFEMIYAHLYRDKADPYLFYRLTRMIDPPIIVPIRQISHAPQSVTARIVGSYLTEGITASLVDDTERVPSKVENLLR